MIQAVCLFVWGICIIRLFSSLDIPFQHDSVIIPIVGADVELSDLILVLLTSGNYGRGISLNEINLVNIGISRM